MYMVLRFSNPYSGKCLLLCQLSARPKPGCLPDLGTNWHPLDALAIASAEVAEELLNAPRARDKLKHQRNMSYYVVRIYLHNASQSQALCTGSSFIIPVFVPSEMTMERDFPQNPTQPSLRYAVSTLMPLALPWTNAPMPVGRCLLDSSEGSQFHFGKDFAFDMDSLYAAPLVFTETRAGQVNQATVSGSSNSHRDLSADIAGSIGGSVLGGSARGKYSKNSNQDESVRCTPHLMNHDRSSTLLPCHANLG